MVRCAPSLYTAVGRWRKSWVGGEGRGAESGSLSLFHSFSLARRAFCHPVPCTAGHATGPFSAIPAPHLSRLSSFLLLHCYPPTTTTTTIYCCNPPLLLVQTGSTTPSLSPSTLHPLVFACVSLCKPLPWPLMPIAVGACNVQWLRK